MIEVADVYTDSPFVALLLYQDWVGEPLRVVCRSDEIDSQQPVNLFAESLASLRVHLPWLLLDWLALRVN